MKKGRYLNPGVLCPFYKGQNNWVIYCKGPESESTIHYAAADPGQRKRWQERYCGMGNRRAPITGDYEKCPIFRMVLKREKENDAGE